MLKKLLLTIVLPLTIFSGTVQAEKWTLTLAPSYRSFSDVDISNLQLSNPAYLGSDYINGADNGGGFVTILDPTVQAPGAIPPLGSLDSISLNNASADLDDSLSITLAAEYLFARHGNHTIHLQFGITTFSSEIDDTFQATVNTDQFNLGLELIPGSGIYGPGSTPSAVPGAATTSGEASYDFELRAYSLHLGLGVKYNIEKLRIALGFGPTLTLVDSDLDVTESATWTAGAATGTQIYSKTSSDSSNDWLVGLYLSIGIEYSINERWAVGLEYRFDQMLQDLDTDYLEADLSGSSARLNIIYSF